MQRLFDMKLAEGSEGLDVVGLVEQQPALLLQPDGASGGVTSDESAAERLQAWQHGLVSDNASEWARRYSQLQQYSQRCGLGWCTLCCWGHQTVLATRCCWLTPCWRMPASAAASSQPRPSRCAALSIPPLRCAPACLPACRHGDGHVGCRDTDDAELTRWATKQRSEHRSGQLSEEKREQLQVGWMGGWAGGKAGRRAGGWADIACGSACLCKCCPYLVLRLASASCIVTASPSPPMLWLECATQAAGFEFDAELAEWLRWFNEIRAFHQREGHCQPQPLAHPNGACALGAAV